MLARLKDVARIYSRPSRVPDFAIGRVKAGIDARHYVYVFTSVREEGVLVGSTRQLRRVHVHVYNKLKHGFNATCSRFLYHSKPRAGMGLRGVAIEKSNEVVDRFGKAIDLMGFIQREFARILLDADERQLL
jgi:hypothetical protein